MGATWSSSTMGELAEPQRYYEAEQQKLDDVIDITSTTIDFTTNRI